MTQKLLRIVLSVLIGFVGISILPPQGGASAGELLPQAGGGGWGFLAESYLESDGVNSQGRRCHLGPDGGVDESTCVRFRVNIANAVDPNRAHAYQAYGAYLTHEAGGATVRQSLYDSGGAQGWYRSCPIQAGDVQWSQCEHAWQSYDPSGLGFGHIEAYGAFTYQAAFRTHLTQQVFGDDGRIWARSCPTRSDGSVDWNACSGSWHEVGYVFALSNKSFSDYGAYTFVQGDRAFLREVLLERNGNDEWSRTCRLYDGKLRTMTFWGMMEVDPDYSLENDCGDLWSHRDLRQVSWVADRQGRAPQGFLAYDAYYFNPSQEVQRRLGWMVVEELEGYGHRATGGPGGRTLTVTSTADSGSGSLRWALGEAAKTSGAEAIVFAVNGEIRLRSTLDVPSNTTIDGYGQDVALSGYGFQLEGVRNVIISYLTLRDGGDTDAIEITSDNVCSDCQGPPIRSQDIWIHHLALSDYGDGLLDICKGATDITVSWSHFSNHSKVMLIGCSNKAHHAAADAGIRVTLHHNYFDGTVQRNPRVRQGMVDIYNNYYRNWRSYAIASSMNARVRVGNNVFDAGRSGKAIICHVGSDPQAGLLQLSGNWFANGAWVEADCAGFDGARDLAATVQAADQRLINEIVSRAGDTR
jgi:pectate lyase